MMGREIEMLRTIGESCMKRISEELRADSSRTGIKGTMNTGSWSNDSGIVRTRVQITFTVSLPRFALGSRIKHTAV